MNVLRDGASVFQYLQERGGLDTKRYDKSILSKLREHLSLPEKGDIKEHLIERNISSEEFIIAFFKIVAPFTEMMEALYVMFEKAGANKSNKNVIIKFDSDPNKDSFNFNISNFAKWISIWKNVNLQLKSIRWDYDTLWGIYKILSDLVGQGEFELQRKIVIPGVIEWLEEYKNGKWSDQIPNFQSTNDVEFDKSFRYLVSAFKFVVDSCRFAARDRMELLHNTFISKVEKDELNILMGRVDSDNWCEDIIKNIYLLWYKVKSLPDEESMALKISFLKKTNKLFKNLPFRTVDAIAQQKLLEEIIELPIWERRYELYAAWIYTEILEALDSEKIHLIHEDGLISFSFSRTHLATIKSLLPEVQIWSELRSELKNPIGGKRKGAIQPDYSLLTNDNSVTRSTFLVIECKQYLKASSKNFSEALTDYANGRPNSEVLLVNYGKANSKILTKVEADLRSRVQIIGEMHPHSNVSRELFKRYVQNATFQHCIKAENTKSQPNTSLAIKKVTLEWELQPQDLDLYLNIKGYNIINFSSRGNLKDAPWAELQQDIQNGYGPEIIEIEKMLDTKYTFLVHNYSNEIILKQSNAVVKIEFNIGSLIMHCPNNGEGSWWHLFSFDAKSGDIELINIISMEDKLSDI